MAEMDQKAELLPCPFCGGELIDIGPNERGEMEYRCWGKVESGEFVHPAIDMTSAAWNRRASPLPADGLVERLRARRTVNLAWPDDSLLAIQAEQNLCIEAATVIQTIQRERDEAKEAALCNFNSWKTAVEHVAAAEQQVRDMLDALNWALGTTGEFQPSGVGTGPFWWRAELAARVGLTFDRETCTYRLALKNQESDRG